MNMREGGILHVQVHLLRFMARYKYCEDKSTKANGGKEMGAMLGGRDGSAGEIGRREVVTADVWIK